MPHQGQVPYSRSHGDFGRPIEIHFSSLSLPVRYRNPSKWCRARREGAFLEYDACHELEICKAKVKECFEETKSTEI